MFIIIIFILILKLAFLSYSLLMSVGVSHY